MKRRTVHAGFAALALCCAAFAGYHGWRLVDALRGNAAVLRAATAARSVTGAGIDRTARVRLAQAVALWMPKIKVMREQIGRAEWGERLVLMV
jgi:mxaK protein